MFADSTAALFSGSLYIINNLSLLPVSSICDVLRIDASQLRDRALQAQEHFRCIEYPGQTKVAFMMYLGKVIINTKLALG